MAEDGAAANDDVVVLGNGHGDGLQCRRGRLRRYAPDSIVTQLLDDLPDSARGLLLPGAPREILERLHLRLANREPPLVATLDAAVQLLEFCDCYDLPTLAQDAHAFWTRSPAAAVAALDAPPARLAPASARALRLHLSCWALGHPESIAHLLGQRGGAAANTAGAASSPGDGDARPLPGGEDAFAPLRIRGDVLALAAPIEADDVAGTARALCSMPLPWAQARFFATEEVADRDLGRRTRMLHATALAWAVYRRRSRVVELLLRGGADPNATMMISHTRASPRNATVYQDRDEAHTPALHLALAADAHQIVALLDAWGVDRHATSSRLVYRRWRPPEIRGIQIVHEETAQTTDEVMARGGR